MRRCGIFALFFAILFGLGLSSCTKDGATKLDFLRDASFCAEIEGSLGEGEDRTDFAARILVERTGSGEKYQILYRAPEVMEGVEVIVEKDPTTGEETVSARLGELSLAVSHDAVAGWLMPMEALLSVASETPVSLQKGLSGLRLVFDGEKILALDEKGLPLSLTSPEISLLVKRVEVL